MIDRLCDLANAEKDLAAVEARVERRQYLVQEMALDAHDAATHERILGALLETLDIMKARRDATRERLRRGCPDRSRPK
jgi:hypothetical protein